MAANSEQRIVELGKLLKGRVRDDWTLLDETYREPFDELMGLLTHRQSVVASIMQAKGGVKGRETTPAFPLEAWRLSDRPPS